MHFRDILPSAVELEFHEYITITVHLPDDLQNLLLYDLDLISKRRKVTKLPARVTVNDITDKYVLHKMSMSDEASKYKETAYGIRDYFDAILPRKLLYTSEKAQYNKIADSKQNENIAPSSLYGAVHLVRMFVKMGHLLAHLPLDTYGTDLIEENVNDYVRYLNLNISKFVNIDDYQTASSDYGRKARG